MARAGVFRAGSTITVDGALCAFSPLALTRCRFNAREPSDVFHRVRRQPYSLRASDHPGSRFYHRRIGPHHIAVSDQEHRRASLLASRRPLRVLSGLVSPTEGSIYLGKDETDVSQHASGPLSLSARVGLVFQFPERYFLTDTIVEELLFGYSRQLPDFQLRHSLTLRLETAIAAVGLSGMPLSTNPRALSDGYKRRLALAVQLVRSPDVLLLDEPLAGLDWKARIDVVRLLSAIKKEKTLLIVSHDLKELVGLVDKSWQMEMGGKLTEQSLEIACGM